MFKKIAITTLLLSSSITAFAGQSTNVNIKLIRIHEGNIAVVETTAYHFAPSCHGGSNQYAFKINSDQGKAMLSTLMSAANTNKTITIVGTGSCTDWPDREAIRYIDINY